MIVHVTPAQFSTIKELKFRYDNTRDPADLQSLIGQIACAALDHGDRWSPSMALMGIETKLVVEYRT